jgi:hypothetical protein
VVVVVVMMKNVMDCLDDKCWQEKTKVLHKSLHQCPLYSQSHLDCPETEPMTLQWEVSNLFQAFFSDI